MSKKTKKIKVIPLSGRRGGRGDVPDLESALARIEAQTCGERTPGTTLGRAVLPSGIGWVLSLGPLGEPKRHFYGATPSMCIDMARSVLGLPE